MTICFVPTEEGGSEQKDTTHLFTQEENDIAQVEIEDNTDNINMVDLAAEM